MNNHFEFREALKAEEAKNAFVVMVPAGISSKAELLRSFARAAKFPDYFGENWDAFLDCLRDFEWIDERQIVIQHEDLPLRTMPRECRTYLEILRDAVADWSRPLTAPEENFPEHELRVIFPEVAQSTISDLLRT